MTEKQTMPWAGTTSRKASTTDGDTAACSITTTRDPESYDHHRVTSATMTFEHRFSDVWSVKFGANAFVNPYNDQLIGSGAYYPYGTGNVTLVQRRGQPAVRPGGQGPAAGGLEAAARRRTAARQPVHLQDRARSRTSFC